MVKKLSMVLVLLFLMACGSDQDIPIEETPIMLAAGEFAAFRSAAIDASGTLWMWGENWNGQLGDGTTERAVRPVAVMENMVKVVIGVTHTLAICCEGVLWGWGMGGIGIGGYESTSQLKPFHIMDNVRYVTIERAHTFFITYDNRLFSFGTDWEWDYETYGEMTLDDWQQSRAYRYYRPVELLQDVMYVTNHAAITSDGSLWRWGGNRSGQVGDGTTENRSLPVRVKDNVVAVATTPSRSFAICTEGFLWAWGSNEHSLGCGNDDVLYRVQPYKIMENVVSVFAEGSARAWAICVEGFLWGWGERVGFEPNTGMVSTPKKLMGNVAAISACSSLVLVLDRDGVIHTLGGHGFIHLDSENSLTDVIYAVAGSHHALAVTADGELWAWGSNIHAVIGDGTDERRIEPYNIMNLLDPPSGFGIADN